MAAVEREHHIGGNGTCRQGTHITTTCLLLLVYKSDVSAHQFTATCDFQG